MALIGTLTGPANSIVGRKNTMTLSILNNGGSSVTISNIDVYFTSPSVAGRVSPISFPPGATVIIPSSSTQAYTFDFTVSAPSVAGNPLSINSAPPSRVSIGATIYDATPAVTVVGAITLGLAQDILFAQNQLATSPGWLDLTQPGNAVNLLLFML